MCIRDVSETYKLEFGNQEPRKEIPNQESRKARRREEHEKIRLAVAS
jgi:hypothetical protein